MSHCHTSMHIASDCHTIEFLQCSVSELIKLRNVLEQKNSKTAADVAQLKQIEDQLRSTENELLKQMEQQEREANASHEELKAGLQSIQSLLSTREEDLAKQVEESNRLAEINEALDAENEALDEKNKALDAQYVATVENSESRRKSMECAQIDLEKQITALLCEQNAHLSRRSFHGHMVPHHVAHHRVSHHSTHHSGSLRRVSTHHSGASLPRVSTHHSGHGCGGCC